MMIQNIEIPEACYRYKVVKQEKEECVKVKDVLKREAKKVIKNNNIFVKINL